MLSHLDINKKSIIVIHQKIDENIYLSLQNDCLLEKIDGVKTAKVSLYKILSVIIAGNFTLTSNLINKLTYNQITVIITNDFFNNIAIIEPEENGNYDIRIKQYSISKENSLKIANLIIKEKIKNQNQLLYFLKKPSIEVNLSDNKVSTLKEILGLEGVVSREYFNNIFSNYNWYKRMPQSKIDEINFLMDFGYSLLFNLINCFCLIFGLDRYKGFYHQLYFQRKSLVCDLIEPFRVIIDLAIINAFNFNIYKKDDFKFTDNLVCGFKNGYKTKLKYLKFFLKSILSHKIEIFQFIKNFYFYIADSNKYKFPDTKINFNKLPISLGP